VCSSQQAKKSTAALPLPDAISKKCVSLDHLGSGICFALESVKYMSVQNSENAWHNHCASLRAHPTTGNLLTLMAIAAEQGGQPVGREVTRLAWGSADQTQLQSRGCCARCATPADIEE
jgi:hypothetical protein